MSLWGTLWSALGFGASKRTAGVQILEPGSGRLTTRTVNADTAMQISAVFASVRLLAETIACLPLKFYEVKAGGALKTVTQHPLHSLLTTKPNRYQTHIEFFETLVSQLALNGNAYHRIDKTGTKKDEIISLMPYMTPQVEVELLESGDVVYRYSNGKGVAIHAAENIWHNKLFGNGVIGMSPLTYARNSIGIAISAEDRVSKMANSGFKPSGVLMIDKVLTKEQRAAIKENFKDLVEGGEDALRVLEAGMKYEQTSINPKDAQLLESRRFQIEDIARFFGVPSVLINDTSATTVWGSGIQQIINGFYKLNLRPYLERIEANIRIRLLAREERATIMPSFNFDLLLRGDEKTRYEVYANAIKHRIRTPNECRSEEGLEKIDGGDEFPAISGAGTNNGGDKDEKDDK